ncbi:MAG TPA: hypothetical protein VMY37_13815 [Thermoguttaceae bacterium]|nr:hypothetical protein [Thermoguttaceae bacterium]
MYPQISLIRKAAPTPGDLHVDRLLTNIALGYAQDMGAFVAHRVFPIVPVQKQSDKYAAYEKADFFRRQLAKRAPGDPSRPLSFKINTDANYFADVLAGNVPIPRETQVNADAPFNPSRDATFLLQQQAMLEREIEWASTFFATGIWGTSKTVNPLWDAASSTPLQDIETGIKTVLTNTGYKPNKLVVGYDVWSVLKNHTDIVDRVKYGQTPGNPAMVTPQAIAALAGVDEVLVMEGVKNTAAEGQAATMSFISGKHALLAYAAPRPSIMLPSGGYIFTWTGFLGANAWGSRISSWWSDERKSDIQEIEMAYDMKLIASDVGYFFDVVIS